MQHTLLFDVDGILFQNKHVHEYIKNRSVCFLRSNEKFRKKYPMSGSCDAASFINKIGYKTFGHTALVIEDTRECVQDYNDYVFDKKSIEFIKNNVRHEDRVHLDKIRLLMNDCEHLHIGLCTNTPLRYCEAVLYPEESNEFKDQLLNNAFTSDDGLIKPKKQFYDHVERNVDTHIHFLDDSPVNVKAVSNRKRWYPVLIDKKQDMYHYLGVLGSSTR